MGEEEGEAAEAGGVEGAGGGDDDGSGKFDDDESPSRATQLLRSFFRLRGSSAAAVPSLETTRLLLVEEISKASISLAGVARSARATARAAVAEEKPWRRETLRETERRETFDFFQRETVRVEGKGRKKKERQSFSAIK